MRDFWHTDGDSVTSDEQDEQQSSVQQVWNRGFDGTVSEQQLDTVSATTEPTPEEWVQMKTESIDKSEDESETTDEFEPLFVDDTVTLGVSHDVGDLPEADQELLERLSTLVEESFTEVVAKNRDYGFSFVRTGGKLQQSMRPDENPSREIVRGLLHRTGDKRERLIENVFGQGSTDVSDTPAQTAQECANYWLFIALVLQEQTFIQEYLSDE